MSQSKSTGTRKGRGQSTRRRFTFSEPSGPAELALIQETYMTTRQNIPNQALPSNAVQQDGEYATQEERERCALRKGRSLPTIGRAKREKRMADLFSGISSSHDSISTSPTKPRQSKKSKTPSLSKTVTPKPCLADPSTPIRWAGGAFENSPPPSSLPIPVFSDDEGDNEEDDLLCGATSSDGEHDDRPVSPSSDFMSELLDTTTVPILKASPNPSGEKRDFEPSSRVHSANPNQSTPPPAENQPHSPQTRSRSTPKLASRSATSSPLSRHEQQPSLRSPAPIQHPVFMFSLPAAAASAASMSGSYYQPSAVAGVAVVPSQPQPSRDLDQLSSELRKMLGISVST